jgi:hypothetical protein
MWNLNINLAGEENTSGHGVDEKHQDHMLCWTRQLFCHQSLFLKLPK